MRLLHIATILCLAFSGSGGAALAEMQPRQLVLGVITPPEHGMTLAAGAIAGEVETRTGGALTIGVFHSARRGNETAMLAQIAQGELDAAILTFTELAKHEERLAIFFAPFLAADLAEGMRLLATPTAAELLAATGQAASVKVLGAGLLGMRQMVLREPANSAWNLGGRTIRVSPTPAIAAYYEAQGMEIAPLPLPIAREALARGQLDGADMDLEVIWNQRYHEVAPYVALGNHMIFPVAVVISPKTWQTLSEPERHILADAVRNRLAALKDWYVERDARWQQKLIEAGAHVLAPPRETRSDIVEAWWDRYAHYRWLADRMIEEGRHAR